MTTETRRMLTEMKASGFGPTMFVASLLTQITQESDASRIADSIQQVEPDIFVGVVDNGLALLLAYSDEKLIEMGYTRVEIDAADELLSSNRPSIEEALNNARNK